MGVAEEKLKANADWKGPLGPRKCTDPLFLLLLIASWVAMTYLGVDSVKNGDIVTLLAPMDYLGNYCGYGDEAGKPELYFVNFEKAGVCLESCPDATVEGTYICMYDVEGSEDNVTAGKCMPVYESIGLLHNCVITDSAALADEEEALANDDTADSFASDANSYMAQVLADCIVLKYYILGFGIGAALLLTVLFVFMMRIPGLVTVLVTVCSLSVAVLFISSGIGLNYLAKEWKAENPATHEQYQIDTAVVLSYVSYVFAFLWLCLLCWARDRIVLAVGVIKEASRAIMAVPMLMAWPLIQMAAVLAFTAVWGLYFTYTASMGEKVTTEYMGVEYTKFEYSTEMSERMWFLGFCLVWTVQFIMALGQLVVALTVCTYYFTRDKSTIGTSTFASCLSKACIYHLGTVAFGSLLIALLSIVRAIFLYIQSIITKMNNPVAKFVLCCCCFCFWCLDKVLKFINKSAYIMTAINGTSFCASAQATFYLIVRNAARVGAVSVMSDFVLFVIEFSVAVLAGFAAFKAMDGPLQSEDVESTTEPAVIVMLLAFTVGNLLTEVFGVASTALLQCFIADEEMFTSKQRFAENDLKEYMNSHSQAPSSPRASDETKPLKGGASSPKKSYM